MKKLILGILLLFFIAALPAPSHAQFVRFGGLDVMEWPCICEPPNIPIPPLYTMHVFVSFFNNSPIPLMGSLLGLTAQPVGPLYQLVPGAWALGSYTPAPAICGIIYIPPVPPFPGLCIPWTAPIYGFVNPDTGTSIPI